MWEGLQVTESKLQGVYIITPEVFGDHRGWFMESWSEEKLAQNGINCHFVQDNHSFSASKGTLRGLHYQLPPHAQGKLVRVTSGAVFDVAVDIRRDSATFGQWVGAELTAENHRQLWVPPG